MGNWYRPYRYERPPFGEFGAVAMIGERLVCHLCGRDYVSLARHIPAAHGMPVDEYKATFGLTRGHSLWAESLRRVQSQKQTARGLGDLGRQASARRTPAQVRTQMTRMLSASADIRPEERTRLVALARVNAKKGNDAARAAGVLDWRGRETHCKRGHPFDEANTHFWGPDKRWRSCRRCAAEWMRGKRAVRR